MTTTQTESITLYFREGSSDKIYQTSVEAQGDGFIVNFAFGRRGSTLQSGTKTPVPVAYAAAKKAFDKLVKAKLAKGYTPGEDGTPYQHTECQATGVLPQLLNAIDEEEARKLLADRDWVAQEKFDGRRVLIRRSDEQIIGINRKGLVIALPQVIAAAALGISPQQWIMDGECIGDAIFVFDLLERACIDLRPQPYQERLKMLYEMANIGADQPIRFVETAIKTAAKRAMFQRLQEQKREGIVFKRLDAPYIPGRPNSGGSQLKCKFCATASCIVAGRNSARRSVGLELLDGDRLVPVGNVSIPPNQPIPQAGDIVEARYLYAHVGGSLYQPLYLGKRDDVDRSACRIEQLKYKPEDEDEREQS